MEFISTSQIAINRGVKALIYGGSGVGKTRLALTVPTPLIASAEGGLLSLRSANIPAKEITTVEELKQFYEYLAYGRDNYHFRDIFVDSISELAETVLKRAKIAAGKDPRRAYGVLIEEIIAIVKLFRDLPYRNVIILAKEEFTKDEHSGALMFGPSLPGSKLGPELPYLFDEVFRYVKMTDPITKQQFEYLQTVRDHQTVAKDRSGALAPFEAPHLGAIFQKIAA